MKAHFSQHPCNMSDTRFYISVINYETSSAEKYHETNYFLLIL